MDYLATWTAKKTGTLS
ncbi:putative predicted protein [Rhizobium favelukesii]|uniref:Uncharacterized protein n=1 Tax=Rhizobium favelukesii TaxID=348824 RepID=W6RTW8_9HYPH|nr:putative predicted protein [Rhizobium favelukesii]